MRCSSSSSSSAPPATSPARRRPSRPTKAATMPPSRMTARASAAAAAAVDTGVPDLLDDVDPGSREHYRDPALYDYEYRRRRSDVTFYRELARKRLGAGGRILELGAGTGRITIPLARDGHRVVALDQSPGMLAGLTARVGKLPA